MKKTLKQKNGSSNSTKLSETKAEKNSLLDILLETNSLALVEIETILQYMRLKHSESLDKNELWMLTREMLYLKYAVGLMRKHNLSNLNELSRHGLDYDLAFKFKMGRLYPNGVAIMGGLINYNTFSINVFGMLLAM